MFEKKHGIRTPLALAVASLLGSGATAAQAADVDDGDVMVVQATAEQALKQQPGVSIITADDIEKDPPVRPFRHYSQNARRQPDRQQRQRQSGQQSPD